MGLEVLPAQVQAASRLATNRVINPTNLVLVHTEHDINQGDIARLLRDVTRREREVVVRFAGDQFSYVPVDAGRIESRAWR
jgi:hypothetical protein